MFECNEYESDQLPAWYSSDGDAAMQQEAMETQLMIEWFECDRTASRQYLEHRIGKSMYFNLASFQTQSPA
jgi:hypothetical protein